MPCYTPLKGYRAPGGQVTWTSKSGYSDRPIEVACGQCRGCRKARALAWAVRCVHEAALYDRNCFITLTYSDRYVPRDGSLRYRDVQLLFKKLRNAVGSFRFFMCGEYGEQNLRPHYHACLFGVDFGSDRIALPNSSGKHPLFISPTLTEKWGMGHCSIGTVTVQSAMYVSSYIFKKVGGEEAQKRYLRVNKETGEVWFVEPEFCRMSLRPGLGAKWFEKYGSDVFPSDEVVHGGKKYRPPKYYDGLIPSELLESLKAKRVRAAARHKSDLTPERLRIREEADRLGDIARKL